MDNEIEEVIIMKEIRERCVHFNPMTSSFAPFPFPKVALKADERVSGKTPLTGNPSNGLSVAAGILIK